MTITIATITPAQAKRELARRKAAKGTKKHAVYPPAHIMQASGAQLRAVLAPTEAPAVAPVVAPTQPAEIGPFWQAVRAGEVVEVDGILLPVQAALALAV